MFAQQVTATTQPYRLDPCPAAERVCEWYDVPDAYAPKTKSGSEDVVESEDGTSYQRCGGGRRVIRKKLPN